MRLQTVVLGQAWEPALASCTTELARKCPHLLDIRSSKNLKDTWVIDGVRVLVDPRLPGKRILTMAVRV